MSTDAPTAMLQRLPVSAAFDFSRTFDPSPNATVVIDLEHRIVAANRAFLDLTHTEWAAIEAKSLFDVLAIENEAMLRGSFQRVRTSGHPDDVSFVAYTEQRYIAATNTPILDDRGEVGWIMHQIADVTEHYRERDSAGQLSTGILARAARTSGELAVLRQLAARYHELIESAPQQVWTATPDGALDSVNEQAVRYFGKSRETILGEGWQSVVHPDDLNSTVQAWTHSLTTGDPYQLNFRLRGADGTYRWHLARATAVRSADGAIQSWIGTNTDIDEARRDHEDLVTRAAYEEKLIGIVSHDLRNPLGTIALAVPLLERDELTTQGKKAIGYIKAAASRAERLIADLLDFAQARSGTFPIVPGPTDLSSLVRAAVENARIYTGPRAVVLEHRGPASGRWDEGRLTQVIANLVGNAFQHAPPAAIIRVRSAIEGDRTKIEVFNEGPPIAAADLPRLFDPFARGKNAATKQGRSVGLGLYIAHQITLAHGGEIEVASVAGVGTTFTVQLPTNTRVTVP